MNMHMILPSVNHVLMELIVLMGLLYRKKAKKYIYICYFKDIFKVFGDLIISVTQYIHVHLYQKVVCTYIC